MLVLLAIEAESALRHGLTLWCCGGLPFAGAATGFGGGLLGGGRDGGGETGGELCVGTAEEGLLVLCGGGHCGGWGLFWMDWKVGLVSQDADR